MKKFIIALAMAASLLFSGCSISIDSKPSEPVASESASALPQSDVDAAFLEVVREEIPSLSDAPDSTVTDAGIELCYILEGQSPLTIDEVINTATAFADGTGFMTQDDGLFFVGAAAGAYCEPIADEILGLTSGSTV